MFSIFEKHRLVKKGLASPKARRRRTESELLQEMDTGLAVKVLLFAAFVAGLAVLIFSGKQTQPTEKFLIGLLIFSIALAQLWINHPNAFARNSRILLMMGSIFVHLAAIKILLVFTRAEGAGWHQVGTLLIPYAFAPLICSVLLGRNHGIYAATYASLWGAVIFQGINTTVFLVMSLICGFIAVFFTVRVRRRRRLLRAGFFVGLATWAMAAVFGQAYPGLISPIIWEVPSNIDLKMIGFESLAAVGSGILTSILVVGALPVLERLFGFTTDITWLDLSDLNDPLLKRLTIEAPGTYHHSLVVANLAEAAAEAIGANATMSRVCSYFHDIGKLVKPEYFAENMSVGENPHGELAPTMSALIIMAHVKEGIDLALKNKLNQRIVDVIQQHHGTSQVRYFYKRALQQQEDARQGGKIMNIREEDIPEVREESFRYGGPKPQFKEAGIIMLADAVESASRSLEKITPQKIDQLINDIVEGRIHDRQLDDCDLTLREVRIIGESFKFTLQNMLHGRIAYPVENTASQETPVTRRAVDVPPVSAA